MLIPFILALQRNLWLVFEVMPLASFKGDLMTPDSDLLQGCNGDCLLHPLLLLNLKPCVEISFRAPFEKLTYFLLLAMGLYKIATFPLLQWLPGSPQESHKAMRAIM